MRTRPRCRKAARWVIQVAVVVGVVGASVILTSRMHEGAAAAAPTAPGVLGESGIVRPDLELTQRVAVIRPRGTLDVGAPTIDPHGQITIVVTDGRDTDPGWRILLVVTDAAGRPRSWKADKPEVTPHFTASDGSRYDQVVRTNGADAWASAPAGHGLGVATLHATITPWPEDANAGEFVVRATAG